MFHDIPALPKAIALSLGVLVMVSVAKNWGSMTASLEHGIEEIVQIIGE